MKADDWLDRWKGRTVVCIASGPSLNEADCETVRLSGHPTIVCNTSFRIAPWAEVLFGFDSAWWRMYRAEIDEVFKGRRLTYSAQGRAYGCESGHQQPWFQSFGNSGATSIGLAVIGGASKVVLLGYDCQTTGGQTHWHGDHPPGLGNGKSLDKWPRQFGQVAKSAGRKGVPVVNCSRQTALTCFPRLELAEAL